MMAPSVIAAAVVPGVSVVWLMSISFSKESWSPPVNAVWG
jgi:hypothetical protein